MSLSIRLAYGKGFLDLSLDETHFDVTTLIPENQPGLDNPLERFRKRASHPTGALPLADLAAKKSRSSSRVVIVISDHTRPVPDHLLIPWIVEGFGAKDGNVTILVGTGSHRPPSDDELLRMLGRENLDRFRVLCHDCTDSSRLVHVGATKCGGTCLLNRAYCEADIRIATGFIEPHFFAGFSGGAKAIVPGIAGLETIRHFHRAKLIAHPGVTWGETADNPLLNLARAMVALLPPDFIVNVSLNHQKEITELFMGDFISAHQKGCRYVAPESFIAVPRKFPVVVTTNSGYPLDMNFYQSVKGISAAARIVEDGGSIIIASECGNGIPAGSSFEKLLMQPVSSRELLDAVLKSHETAYDQWQVQALLQILSKCRVFLYSSMSHHLQKRTRVAFIDDIEKTLESERRSCGTPILPVAVMPLGPLTIPFVS